MAHVTRIRDAAANQVLTEFPGLRGFVTFDASISSVYEAVCLVELRVHAALRRSIAHMARVKVGYNPANPLAVMLEGYAQTPPGMGLFELEGYVWQIGDGDDSLAVQAHGPDGVTLWVRTWWTKP